MTNIEEDILGFEDKLDIAAETVEIEYDKPKFNKDDHLKDAYDDYKFLRDKLRYLMASGEFILSKSLNALNNDSTPRMVEAASLILRNVVDLSEKILVIHEKTKKIKQIETKEKPVNNDPKDGKKLLTGSLVDIIDELEKVENT